VFNYKRTVFYKQLLDYSESVNHGYNFSNSLACSYWFHTSVIFSEYVKFAEIWHPYITLWNHFQNRIFQQNTRKNGRQRKEILEDSL
jgi:hypothetical protein